MKVVSVVDVLKGHIPINNEITVQGWIRTRRDSKIGISFITINDGSCFDSLQIIVNNKIYLYKENILHLTTGCSISVIGQVVKSIGSKQYYEIKAKNINILGWIDNPYTYPISAKNHRMEYMREVAHLRPRTNLIGAITRVRNTLAQAIHRFMNENGFLWISTPLITPSDSEGIGNLFHVSTLDINNLPRKIDGNIDYKKDFFGKKSFLTVSGQLNSECYACALSKVYTFGPTFRAENSNTSRHLAEFWMVEPELAFANLNDITNLAKNILKYIFQAVLINSSDDMDFFTRKIDKEAINRLEKFIKNDFLTINYTEAIKILQNYNHKFKDKISWGMDLSSDHEKYLTDSYFQGPVMVRDYPKDIKAFYMRINDDEKTVAAMDVLMPGIGEIIGGSQREERLNKLDKRLIEMSLKKEDYWWYRDLRRYGTVPHSGFGLGFERLISYVTGIKNIRDVIPFPRNPGNIDF